MHVAKIVHQLLKPTIHKTRIATLSVLVEGVIRCKELKLTPLGRHLNGNKGARFSAPSVGRNPGLFSVQGFPGFASLHPGYTNHLFKNMQQYQTSLGMFKISYT
jgi:hypothetical protein